MGEDFQLFFAGRSPRRIELGSAALKALSTCRPPEPERSDIVDLGRMALMEEQEMEQTLLALRDLFAEVGMQMPAQSMHDLYCDWKEADSPERKSDMGRLVLRFYGGMGSFNDIVLGLEREKEQKLNTLRDRLWELALHFVR